MGPPVTTVDRESPPFWSLDVTTLFARLRSRAEGLSGPEADRHRATQAALPMLAATRPSRIWLFLAQRKSPITILLIFAAVLSFSLRDRSDAVIILLIILLSAGLGFWQECRAVEAVDRLLSLKQTKATV